MATREDLQADIHEAEIAERELAAYQDACDAGYEGTFEDFLRDNPKPTPPAAPIVGDDDIAF